MALKKVAVVVLIAFSLAMLDFRLYVRPDRLDLLGIMLFSGEDADNSVQVMTRDCRAFTTYSGHLWWRKPVTDFARCTADGETEREPIIVGQFKDSFAAPMRRALVTWRCTGCSHTKLTNVRVWGGGINPYAMVPSPKMALNLVLDDEDELQLMYTLRTDRAIRQPDIE